MTVVMTMNQPSQVQQRFVEQPIIYHSDSAGPDPELKKLLPMVFANLNLDTPLVNQDDDEIFATMFVDKTNGLIRKSVNTDKVMPIAPEDFKGISTYFSGFHPGIDYRAKFGSPIRSILPGTVNEVGFERGGYGKFVIVVHHVDGRTLFSLYAHMRETEVVAGDSVEAGQKLGEVGLTGHTTGPHLHFELHSSQVAMDPLRFFSGNTIAMVVR